MRMRKIVLMLQKEKHNSCEKTRLYILPQQNVTMELLPILEK